MPPVSPLTRPAPARPDFWRELATRGEAPALVTPAGTISYAELANLVDLRAQQLGPTRRLVLLEARNDLVTVVGLLACLRGGHPVMLADPDHPTAAEALIAAYDPDVVLPADAAAPPGELRERLHRLPSPRERRPGTRHELHPDLAVLLSTSGTTGSPKLVRLSGRNLSSNAVAIAGYLGIRSDDVAATTLPLHYCYGLSVLTSHLAAGAAVLLTERSVVDPGFWGLVTEHGVTTFPGVPHTFDLLDRLGFADMDLPSLRYLTCAGGRLEPDAVRRYAELGLRRGFDLFVMYGATEATARMAYLPPDLARSHPHAIGQAIPGGSFHLDRSGADGVGELVYRGDNVMLGYAEDPRDLARGRELDELRTGDLARLTPEGLVEIVGRVHRIAKVFGLRVDLSRVEAELRRVGIVGYAADAGDRVVVAIDVSAAPVAEEKVRAVTSGRLGIPDASLDVLLVTEVPRLSSGKPDYRGVVALHERGAAAPARGHADRDAPAPAAGPGIHLGAMYAEVLRRSPADVRAEDTFVSLGGDSLSYVEASLRLERELGHLPAHWHLMPVVELEALRQAGRRAGQRARRRALRQAGEPRGRATLRRAATSGPRSGEAARRPGRTVETNVVLRALAIVMIVGSHSNLFMLLGGAHLLFGLAGFNFGRFQLTDRPRRERVRGLGTSIARIVVPSVLWLSFAAAASTKYGWENVLLLNGVLGTREWSEAWHYWFVEALVWTLVVLTALLAIPWVDRLERRASFWLPYGLAVAALASRYDLVRIFDGDHIHRAHVIFWLFALGWAAVKAPSWKHRLLVSVTLAATVPGFFDGSQQLREATIVVAMLLLVWVPTLRVPAVAARAAGVLASASLYIYLVHWQIYPAYEFSLPWLATGLSLLAGIAFWWVSVRLTPVVERGFQRLRGPGSGSTSPWAISQGVTARK